MLIFILFLQTIDGNIPLQSQAQNSQLKIQGGGRLVIGQDLDYLEGGFSISQTFHGYIADYQIYSEDLLRNDVNSFINCRKLRGNLQPIIYFAENMTSLSIEGDTELFIEQSSDICSPINDVALLFPEKRTFDESMVWCESLKGTLYLPKNKNDNIKTFDTFNVFDEQCVDSWGTLYWLGVKGDLQSKKWIDLESNSSPIWSNFSAGWNEPSESSQCACVGGKNFPYQWFSAPCETQMCALCKFPLYPKFRIRGLCKKSLVDKTMYIYRYRNGKPSLDGEYHSSIFWDGKGWVLGNRRHLSVTGKMNDLKFNYPFGTRDWLIMEDTCDISPVS